MTSYMIDALIHAGIFSIAAMGLYLLTGLTGQISIAQATYMGAGALISSYLARSSAASTLLPGLGLPFPTALLIATLVTGLLSALFGFLFIRLKGSAAISASIASTVLILYIFERLTFISGGSRGAASSRSMTFGNTNFAELTIGSHTFSREVGLLILVFIFLTITYIYVRNITISPLGRFMRTVRERDQVAQTVAVSPTKTIISAYFLCGLTAGLAGSLYAQVLQTFEVNSTNPWLGSFGIIQSMLLLAFLAVSGMRTLKISVLVVFILSFVESFFTRSASNLDFFNSTKGLTIAPTDVAAIISASLVIASLILIAKTRRKHV